MIDHIISHPPSPESRSRSSLSIPPAPCSLHCGQKDAALRSLKKAIEKDYCAYTALQTDQLLVNLRGTPECTKLLSDAKQCQDNFLAQRDQPNH